MSNLINLEFSPLELTGNNYVSWKNDIETYLESKNLLETIQGENTSSSQNKAAAMMFIRRHLDENLKIEYLNIRDPYELWENLKDRYDHLREVMLPKYRDEWSKLRFQDFKKVGEYNSAIFKIVAHLRFCGMTITDADMMEKTLSTFHASNITLQQQYRIRGFKRYSELIACLLVAEENNELLMRNHQSRPTGSRAPPETFYVRTEQSGPMNYTQRQGRDGNWRRGRGRGRGRGQGRGRSHGQGRGRGGHNQPHQSTNYHQKRQHNEWGNQNPNKWAKGPSTSKDSDVCHRCGSKGHWYKTCRTPEHLCKLYQESKGKEKEVNFINQDPSNDFTRFEPSDFNNELAGNNGDFLVGNEVNFISKDPINEFTYLGSTSLNGGIIGDMEDID